MRGNDGHVNFIIQKQNFSRPGLQQINHFFKKKTCFLISAGVYFKTV